MELDLQKYLRGYKWNSRNSSPEELKKRLIAFIGCVNEIQFANRNEYELKKTIEREDINSICKYELDGVRDFGNRTSFGYENFYADIPHTLDFLRIKI